LDDDVVPPRSFSGLLRHRQRSDTRHLTSQHTRATLSRLPPSAYLSGGSATSQLLMSNAAPAGGKATPHTLPAGGSGEGAPPPEWSPVPVLAVVHGWLRSAALGPAKSLLIDCLVERGELVLPQTLDNSQAGRIVQVEWAFSGKPVPGRLHLPWPRSNAAIESAHDCAACVLKLQTAVALMLDADLPLSSTALSQDVRLFAGQGGPELTWPDLAWFPDRAASPPPDTTSALQLLEMGGTVLVVTRGDYGTRMLEARTTDLCECQPSRLARSTCSDACKLSICRFRVWMIHGGVRDSGC